MSNPTITADDVLDVLIRADVSIDGWTKIKSVPYIAYSLNISKYRARMLIKALKDLGLVKSDMESCYSDWSERYFIVRGYVLTDKARHLAAWHQANIRELAIISECFGMDMEKEIEAAKAAAERDKSHA